MGVNDGLRSSADNISSSLGRESRRLVRKDVASPSKCLRRRGIAAKIIYSCCSPGVAAVATDVPVARGYF